MKRRTFLLALPGLAALAGCGTRGASNGLKVLRAPIKSDGPKSLDPVQGSSQYDNQICCNIYETLLQYKYLADPPALEPLLLAEMPQQDDKNPLIYRFRLKRGVRFHDDPCFENGRGRELVAGDVIYSWKRLADESVSTKNWWLLEDTITGFDDWRKRQNASAKRGGEFDYDQPVEGMRITGRYSFEVTLTEPVQRFMWVLAMFQLSVVPREAVERYGSRFPRHPVGSGPYRVAEEDWQPGMSIVLNRNSWYHDVFDVERHLAPDAPPDVARQAGKRLPVCDRVEVTFYNQDQPRWLEFRSRSLDYCEVPAEYFPSAYNKRRQKLHAEFRRQGITSHVVPLLDFIFIGFNMEDKLVGGYTPQKVAFRKAICAALDWDERNNSFYNGLNVVYDGMIPPGLQGHPEGEDHRVADSYRGPNIPLARELLAEAGYPDGRGLPPIEYYTSSGGNNPNRWSCCRGNSAASTSDSTRTSSISRRTASTSTTRRPRCSPTPGEATTRTPKTTSRCSTGRTDRRIKRVQLQARRVRRAL